MIQTGQVGGGPLQDPDPPVDHCDVTTRASAETARIGAAFPEVLAAAQANGPWAFERLFVAWSPGVAAYLRAQGAEDADGLANEAFLRCFRSLVSFEGDEDAFRSWLFTIAHHLLVDDRRRRARRPQPAAGVVDAGRVLPGGHVEDDSLVGLGTAWVREQLDTLAPDQRDVLLLRILGDLTVDQVAAVVGKRPGAVKALQRRGLAALRRRLDEEGVPL